MRYQLIVVILTYNEEIHIERAINNVLFWADKVIVLDSYSQDNTVKIAKQFDVDVLFRKFDNYRNQRQYAIDYCNNLTKWMLFLDADEYILNELKEEIKLKININNKVIGYYLPRRCIFMGKWIKYGGYYPSYFLRLFRPETATIDGVVNEHVTVSGNIKSLKNDFVDHNLKNISAWTEKHNRYATMEAERLWTEKNNTVKSKKTRFYIQCERKKWVRKNIWNNLPLILRPLLYFIYRYFLRFGFLDGKIGFIYHVLQGGWYFFLIDVKYIELKIKKSVEKKKKNVFAENIRNDHQHGCMKLAINAFNIRIGGGITHLVELLSSANPEQQGFSEVTIWSNNDTLALIPDKTWLKKISVPKLSKTWPHKLWWNICYFSKALKNHDVLFVPGGTYLGKFRSVVTMFQNALPFENREKRRFFFTSPLFYLKWNLLRLTQGFSFRRAQGVVFPSYYMESLVYQKIRGIQCQNSVVIPHGINPAFFNEPRIQATPLIFKKNINIVYVSRIDFYKHQWNVVKAVELLAKMNIAIQLDLYGYVGNKLAFKKLTKEINRADPNGNFIQYHGHLDYQILPELYKKTDIFVFASSCESISSILLEAMASGLAIACSNMPVAQEVVKDAGVYFNPENPEEIKNAIYSLITDDVLRMTCREKAYQYAKQYSWKKCADDTFSFLQKIAKMKSTINSN